MTVQEFAESFIKAQDEAFLDGNLSALKDLEDPDVVYHLSHGMDMVGWEAVCPTGDLKAVKVRKK